MSDLEAVLNAMAKAEQRKIGEPNLEQMSGLEGSTSATPILYSEQRPKGARVKFSPPMSGLQPE